MRGQSRCLQLVWVELNINARRPRRSHNSHQTGGNRQAAMVAENQPRLSTASVPDLHYRVTNVSAKVESGGSNAQRGPFSNALRQGHTQVERNGIRLTQSILYKGILYKGNLYTMQSED